MNNKFLLVFLVIFSSFVLYSCTKDDTVEPGPEGAAIGVRFAMSNSSVFEVDRVTGLFTLSVVRDLSVDANAMDVPVSFVLNEENVFSGPASIHFDAGQDTAYIDLSLSTSVEIGKEYRFSMKIDDEYSNPYRPDGSSMFEASVCLTPWNDIGDVEFYDDWVYDGALVAVIRMEQNDITPNLYRISYPYTDDIMMACGYGYGMWMGGQTQRNIIYTVTEDDHVTWNNFWYTNLIYQNVAGQEIKAYMPSVAKSKGASVDDPEGEDALSIVGERDGDGNILYLELYPYYFIDGIGGFGDDYPVYVGMPGFDLAGALGLPLYQP